MLTIVRTRPLEIMPYAQAKVRIYEDSTAVLVSYATEVAAIDGEGWVRVRGLYSATTRRHISAFAREYRTDYYKLKKCYEQKLTYNIYTGEFVSLVTGEIVEG
jgi:hypothetical protein